MASRFVHLHVHSHYSLLEALPRPKEILKAAKEKGMDAFALTDNGSLYGIIETYGKAEEAGVKLIIGMDAYLALDGRHQKRHRIDHKPARLVLLAETLEGYRNLMKLSSIGFLEGFYYKPRIDKELLREVCGNSAHGLIALSGGHLSEINLALALDDRPRAEVLAQEYADLFGKQNFFLELVDRPEIPEQEAANQALIEIGKAKGIGVVATKNTFYLEPSQTEAWKVLRCVKDGRTLEAHERLADVEFDASFVAPEVMEQRFADIPEAIDNTRIIADRCQVKLELGKWNFARFEVPGGKTATEYLRQRAFAELPAKVGELTEEMQKRLDYELSVIDMKGFSVYFLIVSDFIEWARRHGIVTTTRGSAAGSLVSFAVGISAINPMTYALPFERFLNPERPSAPDIDADFADNRRDEVLDYVRGKYGAQNVAQICTFGTMLARGSVRDVGRALGYPYGFVDQVAKQVPFGSQGFPMTLTRALAEAPDLKKMYDQSPQVRRLIDLSREIEGRARHVSVHAAGTVIAPTSLTDFTPLQIDTREGKIITQYEMKSVEAAGLVKMDFLGIRNLSILGDAVRLVRESKGVSINIERIPVDDAKTFELLARGATMGLFQLNGDGMTKYLMDLKPSRIQDIMAMVALYRPGPIESIPEYIKRKHNPVLVSYLDERLKPILENSYGVLVYQDDVMLIAIHLGGYSWLEADKLRKAMGKKIPEEMAKQKEKLLEGFVAHGLSKQKADTLWKLIEPFAAYGFNKAHAASYGMVAYETAYMKANYPTEYMTALMTAESGDLETISLAVRECQRLGIRVLPPDVNESEVMFTALGDDTIRFGLLVVKGLGQEAVEAIVGERKAHGPFSDLSDFVSRVQDRAFNKKTLEALIKAGALDRFGERRQLLENLELILASHKQAAEEARSNQVSLFAFAPQMAPSRLVLRSTLPADRSEVLAWEKELLGLYVSGHPWQEASLLFAPHLIALPDALRQPPGSFVRVGGLVGEVKMITTKKGDPMAFVAIEDMVGRTEVVVFPRVFAAAKEHLVSGHLVLLSAKLSAKEGEDPALLVNSVIPVPKEGREALGDMLAQGMWFTPEQAFKDTADFPSSPREASQPTSSPRPSSVASEDRRAPSVTITLPAQSSADQIADLRSFMEGFPGTFEVCFRVLSSTSSRELKTAYAVSVNESFIAGIEERLGPGSCEVKP